MMKRMIRYLPVLLCVFLLSFNYSVLAADSPEVIGLTPITSEGNLFEGMEEMLPGTSKTQRIILTNTGKEAATFYLEAKEAGLSAFKGDYTLKDNSDSLLEEIDLELTTHKVYDNGKVEPAGVLLYSGKANGKAGIGRSISIADNYIALARLLPGENLVIMVDVSVPKDLGTEFAFVKGKFVWNFYATTNDTVVNPPTEGDGNYDGSSTPDVSPNRPNGIVKEEIKIIITDDMIPPVKLPQTGNNQSDSSLIILIIPISLALIGYILLSKIEKKSKKSDI